MHYVGVQDFYETRACIFICNIRKSLETYTGIVGITNTKLSLLKIFNIRIAV